MTGWSLILGRRIGLDLYANIRPVKLLPGVKHLISGRHQRATHGDSMMLVGAQVHIWGTDSPARPWPPQGAHRPDLVGTTETRSYQETVTLFTEELPFLSGADLHAVMGEALLDWLGWT